MKVLLIGLTGLTGQQALPRLLEAGHTVTALVRRPGAVTARHERLVLLEGDARDAAAVDRAVRGQDAVLSVFGPRSLKRDDLQEVLMRHLVASMTRHGVKRLVNLSAWGASDTIRHAGLMLKLFKFLVLRHVFADKERGEKLLFASGLDHVNVCPGRLTNGAPRGGVKASVDGRGLEAVMTRADLAQFMLEQLTNDAWVRKCPLIGY